MITDGTNRTHPMLYLSRSDIELVSGSTYTPFVDAVKSALIAHASGTTSQPLKSYITDQTTQDRYDRLIAMPASAYIQNATPVIGLKWIGSRRANPQQRGMERASAIIVLNDPETHYPIAIMEGGLISGVRTAAVTLLAATHLAQTQFKNVAIIGCGFIGRLHARVFADSGGNVENLYLYDYNSSATVSLASHIETLGIHPIVCSTVEQAVRSAQVIAACTTSAQPSIRGDWLQEGAFISNVSLADVLPEIYTGVDKLVVDDWRQSNIPGKILNELVTTAQLTRDDIYAELGNIVAGNQPGRETSSEQILLNPMGLAIEDVACAGLIYNQAIDSKVGTWLSLT